MRIAFDARPLLGPRTGVGAWLEGLLCGLAATTDWEQVLALPRGGSTGIDPAPGRVTVHAARPPLPAREPIRSRE